ncbi:transposase [Agrobacterium sp. T29]|uniref:transposase n=1 Tax=Agrobacterium sp. T29 TaxID=2580515 RepID=UPI00115CDE47|nr:transposase [Agrobacterium sp. T29]
MIRNQNRIERVFNQMKQFRGIITRYEKTTTSFSAFFGGGGSGNFDYHQNVSIFGSLTPTSHRGHLMLTKKQTLWALPILIATFAALCLTGYVFEERLSIRSDGLTVVIGGALVANLCALIFVIFSIFVSFGTALIFNASSPDFWQSTGNPFYHLLWRELQKATARRSEKGAD